ncbi:MAG TPA: hypothetical protein VHZ75_06220 [Solirubrobacteraceae bacterium]|nr:hypothetical protein [Solirubrobacteraceae bacterium]
MFVFDSAGITEDRVATAEGQLYDDKTGEATDTITLDEPSSAGQTHRAQTL